ncbi:MAG TPA: response regulator [Bryobacteraceae bacterium]|nr:response regulator [Bryobacteraceae bacterium]
MRIVLIEDSPADVRLFREVLQYSNLEVEVYHLPDGEVALEKLSSAGEPWTPRPDLVFLDLNMPSVGGFEVLRVLRTTPGYTDVPVAVFTSSRSLSDRDRAMELKADRFLSKPNTLSEFADVISCTIREFDSSS